MPRTFIHIKFTLRAGTIIIVQYIIITETYRTKKEQFDTRFGNLVKEGLSKFNSVDYNYDFDSVNLPTTF